MFRRCSQPSSGSAPTPALTAGSPRGRVTEDAVHSGGERVSRQGELFAIIKLVDIKMRARPGNNQGTMLCCGYARRGNLGALYTYGTVLQRVCTPVDTW